MNSQKMFACQLAKFLRLNGDKVISGKCKLSLTTSALCLLNNLFDDIQCNENLNSNNDERLIEDYRFLSDFFKKTSSLKIFHGMETLRGGIDLSRFINLSILELQKVPAHLILGLDVLHTQLKVIICHRSICFLKEIFQKNVIEGLSKGIWTDMKELNVAYNCMEGFDNSLCLMPSLEYFDASHNYLKYVDEIQVLEHLIFLNLSYNQLENVPMLSGLSSNSLKVLLLRNNGLDDLEGIDVLTHLEELDVRYNCLSEHASLSPLKKLSMINMLQLEGNPLFCHKNHQKLTLKYLHPIAVSNGLVLDGKELSRAEIAASGQRLRRNVQPLLNAHQTSINVIIENVDNVQSQTNNHIIRPVRTSVCSNEISICSPQESPLNYYDENFENRRRKSKKKKPKIGVSPVVSEISENESIKKGLSSPNLPGHLQTKQILEIRRKEYKEGWLMPTGTKYSLEEDCLKVPPNTPAVNDQLLSKSARKECSILPQENPMGNITVVEVLPERQTSDPIVKNESNVEESSDFPQGERRISEASDSILVLERYDGKDTNTSPREEYPIYDMSKSSNTLVFSENADSDDSESDSESEAQLFVVDRKEDDELIPLFLKLGEIFLKEINPQSGKVLNQMDLRSLVSVSMYDNQAKDADIQMMLNLSFDTARVNCQKRTYLFFDMESYQEMFAFLKPLAEARNFQDVTTNALQCLKCFSQFCRDAATRTVVKTKNPFKNTEHGSSPIATKDFVKEADSCPHCGSTFVVEAEDSALPSGHKLSGSPSTHSFMSSGHSSGKKESFGDSSNSTVSSERKTLLKRVTLQKQILSLEVPSKNVLDPPKNTDSTSQKLSPQLERRYSDVSTQSSSIAVISDTESNMDTIMERSVISPVISPLPSLLLNTSLFLPSTMSTPVESKTSQNLSKTRAATDTSSDMDDYMSVTESLEDTKNQNYESCLNKSNDTLTAHENVSFVSLLQHKEQFSYDTFTSIDHRLKLMLEIGVFGDTENLEAFLETGIIASSNAEEFRGYVVISSTKMYIFKSLEQDYSLNKQIKPLHMFPLRQIKHVSVISGNQCITVNCHKKQFTFILRDADLCNCFISHFTEIVQRSLSQNESPTFSTETDKFLVKIKSDVIQPAIGTESCENFPEILFHMLAYWNSEGNILTVCIVVTPESIFASKLIFNKITKLSEELFENVPLDNQKIVNLINIQLMSDLKGIKLTFENEETNKTLEWLLKTETKSSLISFIGALKSPWESAFAIELPMSYTDT